MAQQQYGLLICSSGIRKYGSTFYIRITIVVLSYIGPMGKLELQFSLSVSTQFEHQSGEHVESYHVLHHLLLFLLNSQNSNPAASTIVKIGMYKGFISKRETSYYILIKVTGYLRA